MNSCLHAVTGKYHSCIHLFIQELIYKNLAFLYLHKKYSIKFLHFCSHTRNGFIQEMANKAS